MRGQKYWVTRTNGLLPEGSYEFDKNGKMVIEHEEPEVPEGPKNGIVEEGGELYYYVDGVRTYAGLIMIDGDYYYVRSGGVLVRGQKYWVTKTNGLLPEGSYEFGEDGKMIVEPEEPEVPEPDHPDTDPEV